MSAECAARAGRWLNVRAEAVSDPDQLQEALLVEQVTGSVRWREIRRLDGRARGDRAWEIGAGKALSGMIKRIERASVTKAIGTPEDIAALKA
ncbi:hypothetical protein OKA06_18650 [Novosphingobium sp. MW5]|nr:hypothetical protein [Novosphingobium sp. MW5]